MRIIVLHNEEPEGARTDVADVVNAARDVERALRESGHRVQHRAVPADRPVRSLIELREDPPDLVFNLCESLMGDARHEIVIPALLDVWGVRYTGSGPVALGIALRKDLTKRVLRGEGLATPEGCVLRDEAIDAVTLPFPLIVKPTREDASVGISLSSVVRNRDELARRVAEVRARFHQPVLVERFVEGRELYVSLVGREPTALPLHEIDFSTLPEGAPAIVTYDGKWNPQSPEYHGTKSVRAENLSPDLTDRCVEAARAAFRALGLRDYARCDLRLAPDGTPYIIDVNPNCDLSQNAGMSRAASFAGWSHPALIAKIVQSALARPVREGDLV